MLCFVLVPTVHRVSIPLPPERRKLLRSFQSLLEVLFVALPSLLLVWLILNAISDGEFLDTIKARNFVAVLSWGRKTDCLLSLGCCPAWLVGDDHGLQVERSAGALPLERVMRIPTKSAGNSERRRPPIPIEAGQGFR